MDMSKRLLGAEHPDTLTSIGKMEWGRAAAGFNYKYKEVTWCRTFRHSYENIPQLSSGMRQSS